MAISVGLDEVEGPNMTPLIDIMFNLVIFFLLGSSFSQQEPQHELDLQSVPKVPLAAPATLAPEEININVHEDGRIIVGMTEHSESSLLAHLIAARENYPDQGVSVRGHAKVPYERVARVLSICRKAQIKNFDLPVMQE